MCHRRRPLGLCRSEGVCGRLYALGMSSGASGYVLSQREARKAVFNSVDSRSMIEDQDSSEGEESRLRVSGGGLTEGLPHSLGGEVHPPLSMTKLDVSGISRIRSRSVQVKKLASLADKNSRKKFLTL